MTASMSIEIELLLRFNCHARQFLECSAEALEKEKEEEKWLVGSLVSMARSQSLTDKVAGSEKRSPAGSC